MFKKSLLATFEELNEYLALVDSTETSLLFLKTKPATKQLLLRPTKHLLSNILFLKGLKKVLITHRKESVQLVTYASWEHRAFKIITLMASPITISDLLSLLCVDVPVER